MLYFVVGLSVALLAGALFADETWQAVTGLISGSATFIIGYLCADKE